MDKQRKKTLRISELLAQDEIRPLEGMLAEYRRQMEEMKKALNRTVTQKNKPGKNTPKKQAR